MFSQSASAASIPSIVQRSLITSRVSRTGFASQRIYSNHIVSSSHQRLEDALSRKHGHSRRSLRKQILHRRSFFTHSLPTILVPPSVFVALLLTLWAYKCLMTIIFQDKIIYMPYMPPGARSEKIDNYASDCKPVEWEQKYIKSLDGTRLAICIGSLPSKEPKASRHVVICYFQGNGASPPPRMPLLSNVLKSIDFQFTPADEPSQFTMVALAYRGYWTSSGRASQVGIEKDAQALLKWVNATYASQDVELQLILWGQSIGAGVASTAAAEYVQDSSISFKAPLSGLVLETPFSSITNMLIALYPQKWLPYRYLWPFLWNHWDTESALQRIAEAESRLKVLLMSATRDEVVPPGETDKLRKKCKELELNVERKEIMGALHTEASTRREGQDAVARFAIEVAKCGGQESTSKTSVEVRL